MFGFQQQIQQLYEFWLKYIFPFEIEYSKQTRDLMSSMIIYLISIQRNEEPQRCIQKQRFNLITLLSSDIILKILNLKYIPIIRTNYSKMFNYSTQSNGEGSQSVIQRLNLQWSSQSKTRSRIIKELLSIINDFKLNYRIEILMRSTLKQIQRQTYQEYDVLYVPTDELIFLKTNKESSLSKCLPYLEQMNNYNQVK
ncbi:unnamed protein product [Paramecium sonneborni]|uniref:Uncharacterized protein n=1 Tax=Paramecium sonneborni TaxID=65129 RepID=A0A8S1M8D8_9CILI|nr:unnamed protein product [Paramecium sonneborni]